LAEMLLREYAIKWWLVIPPLITHVSALLGERRTSEIVLFSHAAYPVSKTKWLGEKQYLHTALYNATFLSTKSIKNGWWVLKAASQSSVVFETRWAAWLQDTISGVHVHVSPGSVETLVMRGGTTNRLFTAYSLSKISAKNYQNRLTCIEVV